MAPTFALYAFAIGIISHYFLKIITHCALLCLKKSSNFFDNLLKVDKNLNKLKWLRAIASSSLYWRFRHFFQPGGITSYGATKNNSFIINLVSPSKISSVLDFGCAAGYDLEKIKDLKNDVAVYGVDINTKAIKSCKARFASKFQDGFFFSTKLDRNELKIFLDRNNISKIDLVIFDRVFYCFNEQNIDETLEKLSPFAEMIFIDDFYDEGDVYIGYKHRHWDNILKRHNYSAHINIETIHNSVDQANARTMVYKKRI